MKGIIELNTKLCSNKQKPKRKGRKIERKKNRTQIIKYDRSKFKYINNYIKYSKYTSKNTEVTRWMMDLERIKI